MFVSPSGLYDRDLYVMKTALRRGVPVAAVIGGGYSKDLDKLAVRHSIVHRAATQVRGVKMLLDEPFRQVSHVHLFMFLIFQVWKECGL